jgi:hypothetical protein
MALPAITAGTIAARVIGRRAPARYSPTARPIEPAASSRNVGSDIVCIVVAVS